MPTIVVADPSLVVLIGAAGAGKSSLASRHFQPDEILSSDAFRERIAGDAADQRVSAVAFRLLHRELERRLAARQLTVVDATNAVAANRAQLLRRAMSARIWASAIVLDLPADVVRSRNARRMRVVDVEVVDRQLANVAATLSDDRLQREGFDQVVILQAPEAVDHLTVVRRRTIAP
jgi:predicted kinase